MGKEMSYKYTVKNMEIISDYKNIYTCKYRLVI